MDYCLYGFPVISLSFVQSQSKIRLGQLLELYTVSLHLCMLPSDSESLGTDEIRTGRWLESKPRASTRWPCDPAVLKPSEA